MKHVIEKMSDEFTKHLLDFEGNKMPLHVVLHHFSGPDKGGAHDHPFRFTSFVLKGGYTERIYRVQPNGEAHVEEVFRAPGTSHVVEATCIHEIIDLPNGECWTVIQPEAKVREPGFWQFKNEGIFFRAWNQTEWIELRESL